MTQQEAVRQINILYNELCRRLRMQTLPDNCFEQFTAPFDVIIENLDGLTVENINDNMYFFGQHDPNTGKRYGIGLLYQGPVLNTGQSLAGVNYHYYIGRWENSKRKCGVTVKFEGNKGTGAEAFTIVEIISNYNDNNVPDGTIIKVQPIGTFEGKAHGSDRHFEHGWHTDGRYSSKVGTVDAGRSSSSSSSSSRPSSKGAGCMVTAVLLIAAAVSLILL